jgi:hypothetical protein
MANIGLPIPVGLQQSFDLTRMAPFDATIVAQQVKSIRRQVDFPFVPVWRIAE